MSGDTTPFWLDAQYEPRPPLEGDIEAEACVIGGGVCGLSCARRLAQRGIDTVLLEAGTVAGGASGRNGGFLIAGTAAFHNDARERFGVEPARAMYAATLAAQQEIYELAAALGAGDSLRRVGLLRLAVSEEEAEHVREHASALRADGFPGETVERDDLPLALQRTGLVGCLTDHDGALHPARWYRTLAAAAEAAGARIHEGTQVRAPVAAPGEGPVQVAPANAGANATVRARHVVVAADGALPALVPEYAGRVRSRRLHMVATEPLPPTIDNLVYARWGFEYLQQRPDGRILVGGFSDLDGESSYTDSDAGSPLIWDRVDAYLREDLGVSAELSHRWAGVVGYSDDSLPYVGEVPGRPGLYVSGGYSGVGNVPGFMCGRDIADTIAGRAPEPLFPADREPWIGAAPAS
ncbi:MAG TPA: FAD-dependent oxidoreductase [Thermoleophilaceae bacterium]|nr:FAD-dependent oxidoreductase [Thermoleophilaceae bacterium]